MPVNPWMRLVLTDESITRGLGDAEARVLIEWLADWAERLAENETLNRARFARLCRKARALARFVAWWDDAARRPAALQLAGVERFAWPLPAPGVDACDLMASIVAHEDAAVAA